MAPTLIDRNPLDDKFIKLLYFILSETISFFFTGAAVAKRLKRTYVKRKDIVVVQNRFYLLTTTKKKSYFILRHHHLLRISIYISRSLIKKMITKALERGTFFKFKPQKEISSSLFSPFLFIPGKREIRNWAQDLRTLK